MTMAKPSHILALRFSALGDVAMTVPVIKLLLQQYPALQLTIVTTPFHKPLFAGIERLHLYEADFKNKFIGLKGLYQLASRLNKEIHFDAVADLHDVLRSKIIRKLLRCNTVAVIHKGRKQKKELTRKKNKKLRPLKSSFERYADVFESLGYPVKLFKQGGITKLIADHSLLPVTHQNKIFVGIAPFAMHAAKMYALEKMKTVVQGLAKTGNVEIFLFGSKAEAPLMQEWQNFSDHVHLVAGKLSFEKELNLISQMDVMVSMDSANMHLASMYDIPVVSLWGGTHPYLGFYGWGQNIDYALQLDLPCRPSSVFGAKDCPVHGKAGCMQDITPEMVIEKIFDAHQFNLSEKFKK